MKYFLLSIFSFSCLFSKSQSTLNDTTYLQPIELNAVRAGEKTPVAKTNLTKKQIEKKNIGQDLPFILNQTPSVVVNSDAGNGIGYTGIRLRGSDASRINVTLNGIPYNDAESQGTFFVDLPDIASSASGIQVQRGVGTSTNGAGAFGGSINLNTNEINEKKSLEFNNTAGSFASFKNTLLGHSGIFAKHFSVDGRLSFLRSDGYIDRASSRLRSYYGSAAYLGSRNSLRLNIFTGKEKTYQAWNGIDENTLNTDRTYNSSGTEKPGDPYSNETDNYQQTHYQLFYNHRFNKQLKSNVAVFLTRGKGYYEQYKADESLQAYGLPDYQEGSTTITETDLVRRLWLDNYFYGTTYSLQYDNDKRSLIFGGGWNQYDGKHYGEVIWAEVQPAIPAGYRWYQLSAKKQDRSAFVKYTENLGKHWQSFLDIQGRNVDYKIHGFRYNPQLEIDRNWFFFNPKAGISFNKNKLHAYASYGRSAKEPNRDDFEAGENQQPKPEILNDVEWGIEKRSPECGWGLNLYYMWYKDQLVLTGKINDVGAYTRTNIDKSYRAGIELDGMIKPVKWFGASGNLTLSKNKIKIFTEFLDDYDNGGQQTKFYSQPDIAFSPTVISSYTLDFFPLEHIELNLLGKYVSRQYLDNTQHRSRSLSAYYVQDIRASYTFRKAKIREAIFFAQVNNLFSKKYEPNGYSFSYIYGGALTTENFYYPMAPLTFSFGMNLKL